MKNIKLLIVDDSSFMRRAISAMVEEDPEITVVGMAKDGIEAIEKVEELNPDLVTMDIEMPRMNGLEALKVIMERHPLPVLVVSSLTEDGAKATFDALDLGALDYIPKHLENLSVNILRIKTELITKVKSLSGKKVRSKKAGGRGQESRVRSKELTDLRLSTLHSKKRSVSKGVAIVVIGASTGGPMAVQNVLKMMPDTFPVPILVVQHMPQKFTALYAERLSSICNLDVEETFHGDILRPGKVLIAPGGMQTILRRRGGIHVQVIVEKGPPGLMYKPCVDISLRSVAECFPGSSLAVILSGMGCDGREGVRAIKKTGGKAIVQDEASCVVYGMPGAVMDDGLADKAVPIDKMAGEILNMV